MIEAKTRNNPQKAVPGKKAQERAEEKAQKQLRRQKQPQKQKHLQQKKPRQRNKPLNLTRHRVRSLAKDCDVWTDPNIHVAFDISPGTYLGLMIERTRLSPSIDRICSNPDIKLQLSDFDRKLVCKDYQ